MWKDPITGAFYDGDRRAGDVAATEDELAAIRLGRARALKAAAIEAAYNAVIAQGVPYGGKVLQVREQDRPNVAAVFARAISYVLDVPGITWPEGGHPFRMLDNSTVHYSTADFIAMALKAADRVTAIRLKAGALKDALAAASTLEAVAAIDHAAGWDE